MISSSSIKISDFSSHLFWDVNKDELDLDKNSSFIVKRALEYGLMQDWNLIIRYYGFTSIVEMVKTFRNLEPKTFSFILTLSGLQKEAFRCSTTKQ
jgi:hypothetical protein